MTTRTSAPAPRAPLSRDRVLGAALRLADQGGLESLSMRKLGQELGVEAMALYYHFANKDEIVDGIVDLVFAEVELPAATPTGGRRCAAEGSRCATRCCAIAGRSASWSRDGTRARRTCATTMR